MVKSFCGCLYFYEFVPKKNFSKLVFITLTYKLESTKLESQSKLFVKHYGLVGYSGLPGQKINKVDRKGRFLTLKRTIFDFEKF